MPGRRHRASRKVNTTAVAVGVAVLLTLGAVVADAQPDPEVPDLSREVVEVLDFTDHATTYDFIQHAWATTIRENRVAICAIERHAGQKWAVPFLINANAHEYNDAAIEDFFVQVCADY